MADRTEVTDLDEAWEAFAAATRRARGRVARGDADDGTGLTLSQYILLVPLLTASPLPVGELASQASIAPPTATRAIDGLVERGLVERLPHATDRRSVVVALTPAGAKALKRKRTILRRKRNKALAQLDPAEREQVRDLLLRLADLMDEM